MKGIGNCISMIFSHRKRSVTNILRTNSGDRSFFKRSSATNSDVNFSNPSMCTLDNSWSPDLYLSYHDSVPVLSKYLSPPKKTGAARLNSWSSGRCMFIVELAALTSLRCICHEVGLEIRGSGLWFLALFQKFWKPQRSKLTIFRDGWCTIQKLV